MRDEQRKLAPRFPMRRNLHGRAVRGEGTASGMPSLWGLPRAERFACPWR